MPDGRDGLPGSPTAAHSPSRSARTPSERALAPAGHPRGRPLGRQGATTADRATGPVVRKPTRPLPGSGRRRGGTAVPPPPRAAGACGRSAPVRHGRSTLTGRFGRVPEAVSRGAEVTSRLLTKRDSCDILARGLRSGATTANLASTMGRRMGVTPFAWRYPFAPAAGFCLAHAHVTWGMCEGRAGFRARVALPRRSPVADAAPSS